MITRLFRPAAIRLACLWAGLALAVCPAARATSVVSPTFDHLVTHADYIVHAVVTGVSSEVISDSSGRHIITHVALSVKRVISGQPPQPLVLETLGGKVGDEEMVVTGAPTFAVGDEDILFVRGNGRQFSPLVALMHGRYPVQHDLQGHDYVTRSNGAPLYDTSEVSLPMGSASPLRAANATALPLSVSDFIGRIQNSLTQNSRGTLQN
ncbi:MAG TPA: hypothetical protein VHD32_06970 [Candidatus Didemnitutus sp.]|nr:hypothetical protein [Candidatus Didemnitutus sp.]